MDFSVSPLAILKYAILTHSKWIDVDGLVCKVQETVFIGGMVPVS